MYSYFGKGFGLDEVYVKVEVWMWAECMCYRTIIGQVSLKCYECYFDKEA